MNTRLAALLVLMPMLGLAQVPGTIGFTARLDDNGNPVSGSRDFTFKLYTAPTGGSPIWTENQTLTVTNGSVSAEVGASTPLGTTVFSGAKLYLEVTVGTTILTPRTPVVSVPYAIRAQVASQVGSLQETDIQRRVSAACPANSAIRSIDANGTPVCQTVSSVTDAGPSSITGVFAGTGLTGGGSTGDVTLNVSFSGSGSATSAARSDHTHNYLPVGATLTCSGNQKVTGLNANGSVACGADLDTTYTAGSGLSLASGTFSLATCSNGQILKSNGSGWTCGADSTGSVTSVAGTAPISVTGTGNLTVSLGTVPVANGGTGATSASAARSALGAAASGANSDITSLNGLVSPLSTSQGGTGSTDLAGTVVLNQNAAPQTANLWISGSLRTNGLLRTGSNTALNAPIPVYNPPNPTTQTPYGQIVQQINTWTMTRPIATTNNLELNWTGSDLVLTKTNTGLPTVTCHGFRANGTTYSYFIRIQNSDPVFTTYALGANDVVHLNCVLTSGLGSHHTEVLMHASFDNGSLKYWTGILISTFDQ